MRSVFLSRLAEHARYASKCFQTRRKGTFSTGGGPRVVEGESLQAGGTAVRYFTGQRSCSEWSSRALKLFAGAAPDFKRFFKRYYGFVEDWAVDLLPSWMYWRRSRSWESVSKGTDGETGKRRKSG